MKALILAAGYATRLYPLTKQYPKPLLLVGRKPLIGHILDKLNSIEEIEEVIVVTNSKFIDSFREWRKSAGARKPINLVDDLTKDNETRRGAVGDIKFVIEKNHINEDLLVIGGDNLFDEGIDSFLKFAKVHNRSAVIGVYDIGVRNKAKNYGVVKMDSLGKVIEFREKPSNPGSTLVAMCLYYFPKEKLNLIKEYYAKREADKADATGLYIDWLKDRCPVYGFVFGGRWYDIGDYKFYNEAKATFSLPSHLRGAFPPTRCDNVAPLVAPRRWEGTS